MNTDNLLAKLKLLNGLREKALEMESEIRLELKDHAESNRIFHDGDIVEIFDALRGNKIGDGMVGDCRTSVFTDNFIERYLVDDTNEKLNKDINHLRYEIYAIKKDGTRAKHHYFQIPHFITTNKERSNDYYIRKKEG